MAHYIQRFNVSQVEGGPRYAQRGDYKGHVVEVATGYDGISDSFPVHAYVTPPGAERVKIDLPDSRAESLHDAYEKGFNAIEGWFSKPLN